LLLHSFFFFFFSSRRRHTRWPRDWSSDVCSSISYLVFPGTADKPFGPPDLDKLQARCEALVKEIGGASVPLHHWENIIPPPPTPTPTPSPSPSVTPSPTSPLGASASPSATFAFPSPSPSGAASASPTPGKSASPRRVRRDPNAQKSDSR